MLALLVFAGARHEEQRALQRQLDARQLAPTAATAVRAVRAYLTNDDDLRRYRAYAQAILGRPHDAFYVRPLRAWDMQWAVGARVEPDVAPVLDSRRPLVPYRDFFVEYPPGIFLLIVPPARLAGDAATYATLFKLEMALCLVAAALAAADLARRLGRGRVVGALAVAVAAAGVVCTHRYDAWVALAVILSVHAAVAGGAATAGLWVGIGTLSKGTPLLLLPLLAAFMAARDGPRAALRLAVAAAGVCVSGLVLTLGWCGPAFFDALRAVGARSPHVESTAGALLALLAPGAVHAVAQASLDVAGPGAAAAGVAATIAAGVTWLAVTTVAARRARRDGAAALVDGAIAVLVAFMVAGKIFSPQFLVWILPLAVVACAGAERRRLRWALVALLALTQVIYPLAYRHVAALAPWALALILARNLALAGWAFALLRGTLRDTPCRSATTSRSSTPSPTRSSSGATSTCCSSARPG